MYFMRMLSLVGISSQFCCDYYGLSLLNIHAVYLLGLRFASQFYRNYRYRIYTIKKRLGVKFGFYRAMHFSAKRGNAIACRFSVGDYVTSCYPYK